jgi:hypothetical protein
MKTRYIDAQIKYNNLVNIKLIGIIKIVFLNLLNK